MSTDTCPTIPNRIRVGILLPEDRALLAQSIGVVLGLDPQLSIVVISASGEADAFPALAADVDILLVGDISAIARFQAQRGAPRIIVLSAGRHPDITLASIRAGASACVSETASPETLLLVVKRVFNGEAVFEHDTLLELVQRPSPAMLRLPRRTATLSDRELDVLNAMATGANSLEVADLLGISPNTVRTHVKNIMAKLDARSKLEAVIIAIREGRLDIPLETS